MRRLNEFFNKGTNFLKYQRQIITICLLCLLLFSGNIKAQKDCTQNLTDAEILYKNGKLNEVSDILKDCMSYGFDKEEIVKAYRLLALTYIYLDEQKKAEQAVLSLIKSAPDYAANPAQDPIELINLFKSYRTVPIIIPRIKAGGNSNWAIVKQTYLADNPTLAAPMYKAKVSYQFGIGIDIPIVDHVIAGSELQLTGRNLTSISTFNDFQTLTFIEKQTWIEIPLMVKYYYGLKSIHPFLEIGPTVNFLYSAKGTIERKNNSGISNSITTTVDLMKLRNPVSIGGIAGGGFLYKLGKGYLIAEIRYQYLFSQVTKNVSLDIIPQLPYQYGYIDDNYSMSNVSLSVGYSHPIYSPKKIR